MLSKGRSVASRVLPIVLVILAVAAVAVGAEGQLVVVGDPQGLSCVIDQPSAGREFSVYVVFVIDDAPYPRAHFPLHPGQCQDYGVAWQFAAPKPPCLNAEFIIDMPGTPGQEDVVYLGNSQTGISIASNFWLYGRDCVVLEMSFLSMGDSPACCQYPILPDPYALPPGILWVDACFDVYSVSGQGAVVNPTAQCPGCGSSSVMPAEEVTWGKVKSLYADDGF